MEPKKYEYIDSLRGIAILLVILVHTGFVLEYTMYFFPQWLINIVHSGQYGVQLFFIVSAFTLTMSHYNRLNEPNKNKSFFIRRFFRIAPMIYFILIYYIFYEIDWDLSRFGETKWTDIFASMTFTQTLFSGMNKYFPGGWTVSVEFLFYMMLPFLCTKIKNLNSSILFVVIALLFIPFYELVFDKINLKFIFFVNHYSIFYQLPVFALGIFAYWMINDKNKEIKNSTLLLLLGTILLFCFVELPHHFPFALAFTALLILLQRRPYKFLSNKILAKVGLVSYSMYIIHFPVVHFLNYIKFSRMIPVTDFYSSLLSFIIMCIVIIAITYPISYITYKLIEVPGQNLGRKLIKKINQQK